VVGTTSDHFPAANLPKYFYEWFKIIYEITRTLKILQMAEKQLKLEHSALCQNIPKENIWTLL